jgi:hypothetical protein
MAKKKKKNDLGHAKTFGERVRAIRKQKMKKGAVRANVQTLPVFFLILLLFLFQNSQ